MLYIRSYSVEHGYAPSVRDIGDQMEMSPSLVWHHLRVLEREGLIERSPRVARSMRLVE